MTLIPMNGHDYSSRLEVEQAFNSGEEFKNEDNHGIESRHSLQRMLFTEVSIRYANLTRVATLAFSDGSWRAR